MQALTLWRANILLAGGHLVSAFGVFVVLVVNDGGWRTPVQILYNNWTKQEDDTFRIRRETEILTESFYPGYVLLFCSIISGLHHLFAAYDPLYYDRISAGFAGYRWIDYALSAPLMLVVNEILWVAPPDINTLVLLASVQMLIVLGGGAAPEWWWALGTAPDGWNAKFWIASAFTAATLPFIWIWARYAWVLELGIRHGNAKVPEFVSIILFLLLLSFAAFPVVFCAKVFSAPERERNIRFEARFMLLSALAKIPLLSFFATGLVARRSRVSASKEESIPSDEDSNTGLIAVGIAAALVVLATSVVFALDPDPYALRSLWFPWRYLQEKTPQATKLAVKLNPKKKKTYVYTNGR